MRLYNELFRVNRGIVTLETAQPEEPPAAPPAPAPAPAPLLAETPKQRRARIDRMLAESQAHREEQDRAREERQRERQQQRLRGVRAAYGVVPRG